MAEEPTCVNCHCYRAGECHKSWPLFGPSGRKWPEVKEDDWCSFFKSKASVAAKSITGLTDVSVVRVVENQPGIQHDKLVAILLQINPGMTEEGAAGRIRKLIAFGKLDMNEDGDIEARIMKRGKPIGNDFSEWAGQLITELGTEEGAMGYQELFRACNAVKPIAKSSFGKMLARAIENGALEKLGNGKYWIPSAVRAIKSDLWEKFKDQVLAMVPNRAGAKHPKAIWEIAGLPQQIESNEFLLMLKDAGDRRELLHLVVETPLGPTIHLYAAPPKAVAAPKPTASPVAKAATQKPPVAQAAIFDSPVRPDGLIDWQSDFEVPNSTETKK